MRIIRKTLILFMLLTFAFSCSGCVQNVASGTSMEFSFNTSAPADSNDEKIIYICKDMEKLELNAKLTIDSGNVSVQVLDISSNETKKVNLAITTEEKLVKDKDKPDKYNIEKD